jgi:hypothetical protein
MSSQSVRKTLDSSGLLARLRDLTVYLHRGNQLQAESTVTEIAEHLKAILVSPASTDTERAQQTFFAVDEVRTLLSQRDFDGAASAARDATREWKEQRIQRP